MLIFLNFASLTLISWKKWNDLIIDFGRELYLPYLISLGGTIGKDVVHIFGPFSLYFNALWFKIGGPFYTTLILINLILVLLVSYLIFKIFSNLYDEITGIISTFVFLSVFAFAHYGKLGDHNFVAPYSHAVLHGWVLSLIALYLLLRFLKGRKSICHLGIGVCVGGVFLTKPEIFFAVFLASVLGIYLSFKICLFCFKDKIKIIIFFIIGLLLLPVVSFIYFGLQENVSFSKEVIFNAYTLSFRSKIILHPYYIATAGMKELGKNLKLSLIGMFNFLLLIFSFYFIKFLVRNNVVKRAILSLLFIFPVILTASMEFIKYPLKELIELSLIERGLPFILILAMFIAIKKKNNSEDKIFLSVFGCFSFILLFKIFFNVHSYHYGIFLASPAVLLVTSTIVGGLPLIAKAQGNYLILRIYAIGMVVFYAVSNLQLSVKIYNKKNYLIGEGRDSFFYFLNQEGICVNTALKFLKRTLKTEDKFVAFPAGVMLNFLLKKELGIPYYSFVPVELQLFGEQNVLSALKRFPPQYILLVGITTSGQGYVFFGRDYGKNVFAWIIENYTPIRLIGALPFKEINRFGILILKRKI